MYPFKGWFTPQQLQAEEQSAKNYRPEISREESKPGDDYKPSDDPKQSRTRLQCLSCGFKASLR